MTFASSDWERKKLRRRRTHGKSWLERNRGKERSLLLVEYDAREGGCDGCETWDDWRVRHGKSRLPREAQIGGGAKSDDTLVSEQELAIASGRIDMNGNTVEVGSDYAYWSMDVNASLYGRKTLTDYADGSIVHKLTEAAEAIWAGADDVAISSELGRRAGASELMASAYLALESGSELTADDARGIARTMIDSWSSVLDGHVMTTEPLALEIVPEEPLGWEEDWADVDVDALALEHGIETASVEPTADDADDADDVGEWADAWAFVRPLTLTSEPVEPTADDADDVGEWADVWAFVRPLTLIPEATAVDADAVAADIDVCAMSAGTELETWEIVACAETHWEATAGHSVPSAELETSETWRSPLTSTVSQPMPLVTQSVLPHVSVNVGSVVANSQAGILTLGLEPYSGTTRQQPGPLGLEPSAPTNYGLPSRDSSGSDVVATADQLGTDAYGASVPAGRLGRLRRTWRRHWAKTTERQRRIERRLTGNGE